MSKQASSEEWFDAEHVETRFTALLICDNKQCEEVSAVVGKGELDGVPDERQQHMDYVPIFYPNFVWPSPRLINLPIECPATVIEELDYAFASSWSDFNGSCNHIRRATELLLDSLRVNKTRQIKGKRTTLGLHSRIESMRLKYPGAHASLMAIKWLGNAGSHPSALDRAAVFDALDIFESVLHALYDKHPERIKKLVAKVNRRRGPVK